MTHRILQKLYLFFTLLVVMLCCSTTSFSGTRDNDSEIPKNKQMVIESNHLEIDDQQNRVTFTGNVNARGNEYEITCQKLELFYHQQKRVDPEKPNFDVSKIVATGQVKIIRTEGGSASAETAVYFQDEEKIVLTGNPKIRQENDFVEGTKITLFLKEKKSIVEGSERNQVKAVVGIPENE